MSYQKKKLTVAFFSLLLLMGGVVVVRVSASESVETLSDEAQKALDEKQDELESIDAKIKAYKKIIDLKERQGATLTEQIDGLQAQADKLQLEIDTTAKQISELESQIRSLSLRVAEKGIVIDHQKKILAELMRVYYNDYSDENTPTLFASSSDSLLYFKSEGWTASMSDQVSHLLGSVKSLRDGLKKEQDAVTRKKAEVDTLYQDQAERNANLEETKKSKAALLAKTQAEQTKYNGLVDDLQKQRDDIENEIADLESGLSTDGLPSYSKSLLAYPVKSVKITQGYGKTSFSKKAYASGKHNGVDFGGAYGTSIYAAADGKVIGTGNLGKYAYGRWIAIDHDNGMITLYGHLSAIGVSKGDKVTKGEKIGNMGSTGYSTGNHLHFTVFSESSYEVVPSKTVKGLNIPIGATVNPMNYLP